MEQLIAIGKITSTHGLKGLLKVIALTDNLDRFNELTTVLATKEGHDIRKLEITQVHSQPHKNMVFMKFAGIENVEQASELTNFFLKINMSEAQKLPEGSYYYFQLVGLKVYTIKGKYLGKLKEVLQTGANDVYLLEDTASSKPILIPALKSIVMKIDLEKQEMIVDPPAGLLEDEE